MKQPDEPTIGATRKTLPARESRQVRKPTSSSKSKKTVRKGNFLDKDVEKELVRIFGEK